MTVICVFSSPKNRKKSRKNCLPNAAEKFPKANSSTNRKKYNFSFGRFIYFSVVLVRFNQIRFTPTVRLELRAVNKQHLIAKVFVNYWHRSMCHSIYICLIPTFTSSYRFFFCLVFVLSRYVQGALVTNKLKKIDMSTMKKILFSISHCRSKHSSCCLCKPILQYLYFFFPPRKEET